MFRTKEAKLSSIIALSVFFIILTLYVSSISQSDIILNSPADSTWTNDSRHVAGFSVTWSDSSQLVDLASCTLFIQNTSNAQILTGNNTDFNTTFGIGNNTPQVLLMNKTFPGEFNVPRVIFWTIRCQNSSSSPTAASATPRQLFLDNTTFPSVTNQSMNFENNTFIKTDIRIEVISSDDGTLRGETLLYEILNFTRVIASTTATNNTPANITNTSLPDGDYTNLRIQVKDPALNKNLSVLFWNVTVDQTLPVIAFTGLTPVEGNNESNSKIVINFTITERNLESVIVQFDGSNVTLNLSIGDTNTSGTFACNSTVANPLDAPVYCSMVNTTVSDKKDILVKIWVNDSAGNLVNSSERTFSVDTAAPTFNQIANFTVSKSIATYNFEINDVTPASCRVVVRDRNRNKLEVLSGTLGDTDENSLTNCTGTFNAVNLDDIEGAFTLEYNATDGVNRTAYVNHTGVLTRLYTGFNMVTYLDNSSNAISVCSQIEFCNKVSVFNNSGKSFITFSNSTLSVNNGTIIANAEAVHISIVANSWIITNQHIPLEGNENVWNFSLSRPGWNAVGLLKNVSLNSTYNPTSVNSTTNSITLGQNVTHTSWLNTSSLRFLTCKRSLNKCASTSAAPKDIHLQLGYAVWLLSEANLTINRSTIEG